MLQMHVIVEIEQSFFNAITKKKFFGCYKVVVFFHASTLMSLEHQPSKETTVTPGTSGYSGLPGIRVSLT